MSDELIIEFLTETNESLDNLEQDFIKLEQYPDDLNIINNIFRVMHTIKGTCGFIGLHRLEKIAHSAENIMDQIRSGKIRIDPEIISLILEASDKIKSLVQYLGENGYEESGSDEELIERLNETAKTGKISNKVTVKHAPKTPDLDEEIDFDPIPADYNFDGLDQPANKTPDLDEEIDFVPVRADYAESTPPIMEAALSKAGTILQNIKTNKEENAEKKDNLTQQSIRVNIDVLERLMQMVGELVLTRNQLLQLKRSSTSIQGNDFDTPLQRLNHITSDLQEGVMKTRMQTIGTAWQKFPRLIRDLSMELDKQIELKMVGGETELDRQMLEAIKDPLTHMVRNSADHGIEIPRERLVKGKKAFGTITLSAYHEGGHIIIKISDDGKGLDVNRIKQKAIESGLVSAAEAANLSEKQIYQFIFKAGFSTAEKVTAVSGRGVGMDVVVSNIEKIGGTIELDSKKDVGSEFLIKLPLTLAIMPVLIIETQGQAFAIPQIRVLEIVKVTNPQNISKNGEKNAYIEEINNAPVLRLRGNLLSVISLAKTLKLSDKKNYEGFVVVCEMGSNMFGILVDKVFHTEEIVVKPKTSLINDLDIYSGSTILGDGSVIMIIDPNGVLKHSGIIALNENQQDSAFDGIIDDEEISFLTFKCNSRTPKAIPLELVSRLEEIDLSKIEYSGPHKVIQYRGNLMRVTTFNDEPIAESGIHNVIVFIDRDKIMGVVVDSISDIVRMKMDIKSSIASNGILGSMIINNVATDIIDISYYFSKAFSGWLGHNEANKIEGIVDPQNNKPHIMLVDDSAFFRKFMRPVILAANYKVSTFENGLEALQYLETNSESVDLVVTDIDMPVMNGIEFIMNAYSNNQFKQIPFIAMTSHEAHDFEKSPYDMGFSAFISKSERDRIVPLIGEVLGEKKIKRKANG